MSDITSMGRSKSPPARRRKVIKQEKKIAGDEFMAAAIGDVDWLKQSVKVARGAEQFDKNGLSAIHLASIHGRLDCLRFLIEKYNVDVNLPSSTGWRPIHLAISNQTGKRSYLCTVYLLDQGADASMVNDDGITPAHQAACEGHVQCLKALIEVGAKINEKDHRGHTPLDLAKLWSHRNCARILAAEIWHQDKTFVAKEMEQLKKIQMQGILKEIEDGDHLAADKEFYGQVSFDNWVSDRKLKPAPTGPDKNKHEEEKEKRRQEKEENERLRKERMEKKVLALAVEKEPTRMTSMTKDSLQVPNSMQASSRKGSGRVQVVTKPTSPRKESPTRSYVDSDQDVGLHETKPESANSKAKSEKSDKKKGHVPAYTNPLRWSKWYKVPKLNYDSHLKDVYPRDNITKLPTHRSYPHDLLPRVTTKAASALSNDERQKLIQKKYRQPQLPQDVINEITSKDPKIMAEDPLNPSKRSVLFQCKNIIDSQTKKKYDLDEVPARSEGPIHLMDDMRSDLFRNALEPIKTYRTTMTDSTTISGISDWNDKAYPKFDIAHMLQRMGKPQTFPNIKGQNYDINFGQFVI